MGVVCGFLSNSLWLNPIGWYKVSNFDSAEGPGLGIPVSVFTCPLFQRWLLFFSAGPVLKDAKRDLILYAKTSSIGNAPIHLCT